MAVIRPRSIKTVTPSEAFRKVNKDVDDAEVRADAQKAYVRSQLPKKLTASEQLRQNIGDVSAVLDIAGKVATSPATNVLWGIGTGINEAVEEDKRREAVQPSDAGDEERKAAIKAMAATSLQTPETQIQTGRDETPKLLEQDDAALLGAWREAYTGVAKSGDLGDMRALLVDETLRKRLYNLGVSPVEINRAEDALQTLDRIKSGQDFAVTPRSYPKPVTLDEVYNRLSTATTLAEREALLRMIENEEVNIRSLSFAEGITGGEKRRALAEARAIKSPIQGVDPVKSAEARMKAIAGAQDVLKGLNDRILAREKGYLGTAQDVMADDTQRDRIQASRDNARARAARPRQVKPDESERNLLVGDLERKAAQLDAEKVGAVKASAVREEDKAQLQKATDAKTALLKQLAELKAPDTSAIDAEVARLEGVVAEGGYFDKGKADVAKQQIRGKMAERAKLTAKYDESVKTIQTKLDKLEEGIRKTEAKVGLALPQSREAAPLRNAKAAVVRKDKAAYLKEREKLINLGMGPTPLDSYFNLSSVEIENHGKAYVPPEQAPAPGWEESR